MVFAEGLPQLIELDGIALPKVLNFDVPCIPEGKMKKALWYVEHQATHILIKPDVLPDEFVYYILRKDNPLKVTRITKALVAQYESALEGIKDARCKHIESLIKVCNSFHFVCEVSEEYGVPDCEGNPTPRGGARGLGVHRLGQPLLLPRADLPLPHPLLGEQRPQVGGLLPAPKFHKQHHTAPHDTITNWSFLHDLGQVYEACHWLTGQTYVGAQLAFILSTVAPSPCRLYL